MKISLRTVLRVIWMVCERKKQCWGKCHRKKVHDMTKNRAKGNSAMGRATGKDVLNMTKKAVLRKSHDNSTMKNSNRNTGGKAASENTSQCENDVRRFLLAHSGQRNACVPRSCGGQLRGTLQRVRTLLEASSGRLLNGGTHLFPEAV